MFRIGEFYPDLTPDFSFDDCPQFWQNNKIKINVLNMGNEDYMKNIQVSSYIGIALDVIVEIVVFYYVWRGKWYYIEGGMRGVYRNSKDELGPWLLCGRRYGPFRPFRGFGKFKFILIKIILGFGLSFADTITGEIRTFYFFHLQFRRNYFSNDMNFIL